MKWFIGIFLLTSIAVASGEVRAEEPENSADVTEYEFKDDIVEGTLVRPDGVILTGRKTGKSRSLIRTRRHFVPEMLKSVENI